MSLANEEDVEVVADISDETEITQVIEETTPEFLIVAQDSRRFGPSAREGMLRRYPKMKILALATDGNSFTLFSSADGVQSILYQGSEVEILKALRDHAHVEGGG